MAVKERSQIKGTDAQIKAFAGHNGVLAFATDTKSLHVLSGTAGTTTEFLPSTKVATKDSLSGYATKADLGSYATSEEVTTELAKKANTADVTASFAKYTPTANLSKVATSGSYNDLKNKPSIPSAGLTIVAQSYGANSWYRKYSDGWIEQGGKTTGSSGFTLTFPLAFSNTNYSFVCNTQGNSTGYGYKRSAWISSRTATTVTLGSDAGDPAIWYACGK